MQRSAIRRHTPLGRVKALRRGGRVNPVNRKRRGAAYDRNFGAEAERVRAMPCLVTGTTPSEPAHVTSRGAGGGRFDLVPLSPAMHRQQHDVGIETFAACHGLDLRSEADRITLEHPEPLGIRGLARRWADGQRLLAEMQAQLGAGERSAFVWERQLDAYETEALLGWVRRSVEGVEFEVEHVAFQLGLQLDQALALLRASGWTGSDERGNA